MSTLKPPGPTWTIGDYVGLFGGLTGLVGAVIALLGWVEARESRRIAAEAQALAKKNYDRAAGMLPARLEIVGIIPTVEQIDEAMKTNLLGAMRVVELASLDRLLGVNPTLVVKNVGSEPIDTIRVETRYFKGMVDMIGLAEKAVSQPTRWVLEQAKREEYPLSQKLLPGQVAEVSLVRGLLSQMIQSQDADLPDRVHFGSFQIRCYARLVGGPTYDAALSDGETIMSFAWKPNGYPSNRCEEMLSKMQPHVLIR